MKDAQEAREAWLNARNPDVLNECEWMVKRMTDIVIPDGTTVFTEEFEVTFNWDAEKLVLKKYLEEKGYTVILTRQEFPPETPIEQKLKMYNKLFSLKIGL